MKLVKFLSSSGFSLMEVMLGGAILAGLGLSGAYLFKSQREGQKNADNLQALDQFHRALTRNFVSVRNCNATLTTFYGAQTLEGNLTRVVACPNCDIKADAKNLTTLISDVPLLDINGSSSWVNGMFWKVENLILLPSSNPSATGEAKTGPWTLQVTYRRNPEKLASGPTTLTKNIVFNARFDSEGKFRECFDNSANSIGNLQSDICSSMGGDIASDGRAGIMKWNADTQVCERVTPEGGLKKCYDNGISVRGILDDGSVKCKSLREQAVAPDVLDSNPTICGPTTKIRLQWNEGLKRMQLVCQ